MLLTKVFVWSPSAAVQPDEYNISLYFKDTSKSKYVNLGDVIQDTAGNQYQIVNAILPFTDGGQVTAKAIDVNVIPVQDADYNSNFYTPDQKNLWPDVRTPGNISFSQLYDPEGYEYSVIATWEESDDANRAAVGDSIVDSNGKEFTITYLDPSNKFDVQFRVTETQKTGQIISLGVATLYSPTTNYGLFQGSEINTTARTVIRDRDNAIIDDALANSGGGGTGPHDHDERYYTESEVDAIIAGIGGGTIKRNQSPLEAPDGSRLIFTLPNADAYASQTLIAVVNGLRETDVVEVSANTFQLSAPAIEAGDTLRIDYVVP